jgi:hypothetical protein
MADLVQLGFRVDSREVKRASSDLKQLQKDGTNAERAVVGSARSMAGAFRALGASVAALGVANELRAISRETELLERNMLRTTAIVKATGGAAGLTAQQLHQQARALALATLQSTEGVMQAQQILLTFRSVAGETFTRATELAADLATVTGTSLTGSMTQLGKALEDPINGINALRRSGVSFTDAQRETIKSLVETNRAAEAQSLILDELARQYGGVARAEAMGLAGAQDTLAQRVQEARIALGQYYEINERGADIVNHVAERVREFTEAVESGVGAAEALARVDLGVLNTPIEAAVILGRNVAFVFEGIGREIGGIAAQIAALVRGDWEGAVTIGEMIRQDAERARVELDLLDNRITGVAGNATLEKYAARIVETAAAIERAQARIDSAGSPRSARAARESLRELNAEQEQNLANYNELARIVPANAQVTRQVAQANEIAAQAAGTMATATGGAAVAVRNSGDALGDFIKELEKAEKEAKDFAQSFDQLRRRIDPAYAKTMDYVEAVGMLNRAWADGLIDGEEYWEIFEQLRSRMFDVTDATREAAAEADPFAEAWKSALGRIDDAFAGIWKGAFDSFKSFRQSITNAFKQLLAELAHAATTRPIMLKMGAAGGIMPSMASAAMGGASGGGGFGIPGLGGSLPGLVSSVASMAAGTALGSFGAGLASGLASWTTVGATVGGTMAAGAGAGGAVGAGMMAGAALPVIGGLLALGGIFGRDKPKMYGDRATTSFGAGGIDTTTGVMRRSMGGGGALEGLNQTFTTSYASLFEALGEEAEFTINSWFRKRTNLRGGFELDAQKLVGRKWDKGFESYANAVMGEGFVKGVQSSTLPDVIKGIFDGLTDPSAVQQAIQYTVQLGAVYRDLNATHGVTISQTKELVDALGGPNGFVSAVARYQDLFRTEQQKLTALTGQIEVAFMSLGAALPATRDGLISLVDSLDLTNDLSRELYATVLQLAPALDAVYSAAERLQEQMQGELLASLQRFVTQQEEIKAGFVALAGSEAMLAYQREKQLEQLDPLLHGFQRQLWAMQDTAAAIGHATAAHERYQAALASAQNFLARSFASIRAFAMSLYGTAQASGSMYRETLGSARGGDQGALGRVPGAASDFIAASEREASTRAELAIVQAGVIRDLLTLPEQIRPEQLIAQEIRDGLREQADTIRTHMDDLLILANVTIAEATATIEILQRGDLPKDISAIADMVMQGVVDIAVAVREGQIDLPENYQRLILGTLGSLNAIVAYSIDPANDLSKDDRTIILGAASALQKTIDFAVRNDIDESTRRMILMRSDSASKAIQLILDESRLSPSARETMLKAINADSELITKTVRAAFSPTATGADLDRLRNVLSGSSSLTRTVNAMLNDKSLAPWEKAFLSQMQGVSSSVRLAFESGYFDDIANSVHDGVGGVEGNTASLSDQANSQIAALDGLRQEMERTTNALGVELAPGIKSLTDAISRLVGLNEEQARIEKERAAEAKRKQKELEQQRKNEARAAVLDKQIRENQQKIKIFESNIKKWTGSFGLSVSSEIVKKVQEEGVHRLSLKEAEKRYGGKGTYLGTAARLARAQTFLDVRREMLARAQRQRAAIPEFATGGTHMGGLRLVGERGPELEATGPSRVMSNDRLMQALGSSDELVKEVRALRVENMAAQRAIERNTREIKQIEQRWDKIGLPEQRVFA